jgi:hypothetical protein
MPPRLKKNDIARTFKHDCDRQLRISLGPRIEVASSGITPEKDPGPRPGIRLVQDAGHEWERQKFQDVVSAFGGESNVCFYRPDSTGPFEEVDLIGELKSAAPRHVIVEGGFTVPASLSPSIPRLQADCQLELQAARPDIILIRRYPTGAPLLGDIDPESPPEFEVHVIDVKLAAEPSLRHFTEVTFYAMALAAALREDGLQGRYAVAAQGFVWPGTYDEGKFRSDVATARQDGVAAPEEYALAEQLVAVPYEVYSVHVEQFLEERLPRVLDTAPEE